MRTFQNRKFQNWEFVCSSMESRPAGDEKVPKSDKSEKKCKKVQKATNLCFSTPDSIELRKDSGVWATF